MENKRSLIPCREAAPIKSSWPKTDAVETLPGSQDGNQDLKYQGQGAGKTGVIFHRSVAAAAFSGVVGAMFGSPFYMVKTQLQVRELAHCWCNDADLRISFCVCLSSLCLIRVPLPPQSQLAQTISVGLQHTPCHAMFLSPC